MAEFVAYREQFRSTPYPFGDLATLQSRDRQVQLDMEAFLDAALYPVGGGAGLRLTRLVVSPRVVQLEIGLRVDAPLATCAFAPEDATDTLVFRDAQGRSAGILVVDPVRILALRAAPRGVHEFAAGATEFAARCVTPVPVDGVLGLEVDGQLLTGDVWFVGDRGVVLRDDASGAVRVDVVGDVNASRRRCLEQSGAFAPPTLVRTINGLGPDAYGQFLLVPHAPDGETALRIVQRTEGQGLVWELGGA